jgi:hypothetical protein
MITRQEFDRLLQEHDDAVMAAILRAERDRPKADYDEACTRVIRTADALWTAIETR